MKRKYTAFTLVETLIALIIIPVVALAAILATREMVLYSARIATHALAWERGQFVLSIIEPRVLHAGYGLTYERDGDMFQRSFGGNAASSPVPGVWTQGPVQVWNESPALLAPVPEVGGVHQGRALVVLYAVPSALCAVLNAPISLDAGELVSITVGPAENLSNIGDRLKAEALGRTNDLRSWVTFPLMKAPVHVKSCTAEGRLTIKLADSSGLSRQLCPYDEMHYLKAERFLVVLGNLFSYDMETTWKNQQPRCEGVLETWFRWTPAKRLLESWVLTTGGMGNSAGGRPASWPPEAPWRQEFNGQDVVVTRGSWVLRNL